MTKQTTHQAITQKSPYEQTQIARYGIAHPELLTIPNIPVEYITGVCEASGLLFNVSQNTLIPRVETEELVNLIVNGYELNSETVIRILDIGTGSGFLGIAVAWHVSQKFPQALIELTLTDLSQDAVTVSQNNATTILGKNQSITFSLIQSDLLEQVPHDTFDLILANLPYIPTARIATLDTSVRDFEPHLALDGGESGLDVIHRLLESAPAYMYKNSASQSQIWLEIDHTHTATSILNFSNENTYTANIFTDSFDKNRFAQVIAA